MQNNICQKASSEQCNSNCLNKKQKDNCQLHKIDQLEDITIIENFEGFTNHHKFEGHADMVWGIDICKEKNLLVSASSDKTVKLWNLANNTLIKTYTYSSTVSDVVFSKQGTLLAFGGQGDYSIKLHNISEHDDLIANFVGHNEGITRLVFTNDSKYLISGSGDKQLIIWDVQQRKQAFHLQSEAQVFGVAINSSDSLIASNSFDGKIRIWRFQNHKILCIQQAHIWGAGIDFSQDDKMLVSSEYIGKIKLWSLEELNHNCKLLLIRQFQTATRCIWTVFFSPCSRYIIQICNRDSLIKIIDQQTGKVVKQFESQITTDAYIIILIVKLLIWQYQRKWIQLHMGKTMALLSGERIEFLVILQQFRNMRPVVLQFSNTREVQREELFLLTIVERILAGHMETISFVDLAQFCELMRKKPIERINPAHAQILRMVERKLAKPTHKAQEFQYVIKTVCTSPKSSVTKAFQSEFKKPKLNQQLSDSKHQEQQTIEMSDQNIQQQLGELIQKSQTQLNDVVNTKDPRYHSMKNLDQQKFGLQKGRIEQFDKIQIYDLKEEITKQNTEQQQQLRQNTQITQNSQQQQQLPSTAHSKVASRNNSKMNSKNNSRANSKHDIAYDSRQELKQELKRLEAEEEEEGHEQDLQTNKNNSQHYNVQLPTTQDKSKQSGKIIDKINTEQYQSNDLTNDLLSISSNQQQFQQSQDETKSYTKTDDIIIEKYDKNQEEMPNHFINKIASAQESRGQGYINMDEISIEQQVTFSQEEPQRNCKSDQEFQPNVHYYSSTQKLENRDKEKENQSQTSILEEQPIQINIQVNNCDNQQTIVEESQDGSPNQRTKIFIAYPKESKQFDTLGDNSLQTPSINQQGSFNLHPVSPNLLKAEDQNWQTNSNRSKLQTPQSNAKIPIPSTSSVVNRSRTTKSNFKKLDTQNSQLSINQLNQQDSLGFHNQQSIHLQNQKSEESQPESKMTIESSQGEKSNRSKNVKPSKGQLKIPGAAAAVQFAKRKNSAQPIDPKKLEQQEKERQKQLEYQKLIDRMKLERELMEQYKIPENMPLSQKKLIIESLINQLGEIKDQEAKYQIMLYNQRQEQIANARQGNQMEFTTDLMSNCYADMEFLFENKLKIKSKEEQKVQFLKFSDQIHTHFPGQGKEFLKDEESPLKRTYNKISGSDPIQIEASLKRKDGFIEESELLKLFQRFDSEYGKKVFQCDMDHPTIRDQNQNGYEGQNGLLPKLRKRKMTRVTTTSGRIELSTYRVDPNKIDLLRFKAQRISQVGRFLISSQ